MKNSIKFVGPVGPAASGKGRLIDALVSKGFTRISLSYEIRADLERLYPGKKITREDYQNLGDEKRREFGNDYWAKRAGDQVAKLMKQGATNFAIDSFRNPDEVLWFKRSFQMIAIAVDAPLELRLEWAVNRARGIDPTIDINTLQRDFERDMGTAQPEYGQQVSACVDLSDQLIINDGSLAKLDKKIEDALLSVGVEGNHNHREKK